MNLFKKKKNVSLKAPVTGTCIALDQVPDKVFADKLMGDGIAFIPDGDIIASPCDGKVVMIAETLHAIGIQMKNGIEILIHVGLDTVNLHGQGFEKLVETGDKVTSGTPILKIDREFMKQSNIDLTTPMVFTELNGYKISIEAVGERVIMGESDIITIQ